MAYDGSEIDEMVLALLGATEFENGRVRRRIDFAVMDRLHGKGYITDPHGKQESVHLTRTDLPLEKGLAARHFAKWPLTAGRPHWDPPAVTAFGKSRGLLWVET